MYLKQTGVDSERQWYVVQRSEVLATKYGKDLMRLQGIPTIEMQMFDLSKFTS